MAEYFADLLGSREELLDTAAFTSAHDRDALAAGQEFIAASSRSGRWTSFRPLSCEVYRTSPDEDTELVGSLPGDGSEVPS